MMPLWLDMLRTPMAAPETRGLRRRRRLWQFLCIALAISVFFVGPLRARFGPGAGLVCGVLLWTAVLSGICYFRKKNAADNAWLARRSEEGEL